LADAAAQRQRRRATSAALSAPRTVAVAFVVVFALVAALGAPVTGLWLVTAAAAAFALSGSA
jgi:hypothetical protein